MQNARCTIVSNGMDQGFQSLDSNVLATPAETGAPYVVSVDVNAAQLSHGLVASEKLPRAGINHCLVAAPVSVCFVSLCLNAKNKQHR